MKQLQHRNIFGRVVKVGGGGEGVSKVASLPENGEEGKIYYNTTEKKYYTYTSEDGFSEIGSKIKIIKDFMFVSKSRLQDNAEVELEDVGVEDCSKFLMFLTDSGKVLTVTPSENEGYGIVHISDPDPNTIYYDELYHHYFRIGEVQVTGINDDISGSNITTFVAPILVYSESIYIPSEYCSVDIVDGYDMPTGVRVGVVPLIPAYYCDMGEVSSIAFSAPGEDQTTINPLIKCNPIVGRFTAAIDDINITFNVSVNSSTTNPDIEADHTYEYSILDGVFSLIDITAQT